MGTWGCDMLRRALHVLTVSAALCSTVALGGCAENAVDNTPLVIGYLGGISGRSSSLGLAGRDGALLAVEQLNADGGVNGRRVVLEVADDGPGPEASQAGMRELARKRAVAVVGPMTSSSASAAAPVANELKVPLLSPTVSSTDFTGKDDYFLRTCSDNKVYAEMLAVEVAESYGVKSAAVIADAGNSSYAFTLRDHFSNALKAQGGTITSAQEFVSGQNPDYSALAAKSAADKPDAVFVVANPIDTGLLAQRLRQAGYAGRILIAHWAVSSDDLISSGGSGVENALFLDNYDRASTDPSYKAMTEAFVDRFGYEPTFASVHAYDAVMMVANAATAEKAQSMREKLLGLGVWTGIQGNFELDDTGDTVRSFYPMTIRDGKFVAASTQ